ncbi:MAG: protein BatD [Eudoraea sp.]|nr:protein BatD [Eudoraea sp.]
MIWAQDDEGVIFEMKASAESLGVNEKLRLDFVMNQDGDNFNPPEFSGFKLIMGPTQSISSSWINGNRTYSKTYSYTLQPTALGTFKIGQASIEIDGKTYKTIAKNIKVTEAVDRPNSQPTADDIADANLHLVAEVSKSSPYLNEAISVVYKLYVSPSINVSNFRPLDNPKYNNFWSQDIAFSRYNVQNGTYQGKPYRYVVLKRVVLYPQKSGQLEIAPLSLEVSLEVPTSRRDFFGGRIYKQTTKNVSAGRRVIQVKALPENGKPADFSGAVGDFKLLVTTTKNTLNAQESLQAKVEVSGKGNLKLFQLPDLQVPSALEVYEPEYEENVRTTLSGMQGKVSNNYTVVPEFRGKYPIPPVNFSFFNPTTARYENLISDEIIIDVLEGPVSSAVTNANADIPDKVIVENGKGQFSFLKLDPNFMPINKEPFFGTTRYFTWLFAPILLVPLVLFIRRKRREIAEDVEGNKLKRANKLARKFLSTAKKELGNREAFYVALEKALHNYLKAKLRIETSEFSKDKISGLLTDRQVSEGYIDQFIALLKSCEMARYSPFSREQMQQDYEQSSDVISAMDKQL